MDTTGIDAEEPTPQASQANSPVPMDGVQQQPPSEETLTKEESEARKAKVQAEEVRGRARIGGDEADEGDLYNSSTKATNERTRNFHA